MIIKKILFSVASIISLFILQFFFLINSNSDENNSKYYSNDNGILSLMYHRFNENKYPSTNVRMEIFEKQIQIIKNKKYKFENPDDFQKNFEKPKAEKKILEFIEYFKNQELPVFPIKAEDLMKKFNLTEGKKIGEYLKLLEDFWIKNNFSITEKDLERIVKN